MIKLMLCDGCGYVGDLSDMPGDPDTSQMKVVEAYDVIVKEMPKVRNLFQRIGWVHLDTGEDLCPDCAKKDATITP